MKNKLTRLINYFNFGASNIVYSNLKNVNLEDHIRIMPDVINTSKMVSIGRHTYINRYVTLGTNLCKIGRFCSIGSYSNIGAGPHPLDLLSTSPSTYKSGRGICSQTYFDEISAGHTVIGNDVWIGSGAVILAGVKVADGAVVGANSVVTKDIEPYSIVAGSPAKHIKYRFQEPRIKKLLSDKWWLLDDDSLKEYISNELEH